MNNVVFENEITVEVDAPYESLKDILSSKGFNLVEEYDLIDVYMLRNDNAETEPLSILKNCVLIRNIITKDKEIKKITYKYKEYNDKKEIIKQGKVECGIEDEMEAQKLLEVMGYHQLIKIVDHSKIFSNGVTELAVQLVNDKHIYIELEENGQTLNTVEDLKREINSYGIPFKSDNYFVKKAEIELLECAEKNA